MIYEIKNEQYDELLRISQKKDITIIQYEYIMKSGIEIVMDGEVVENNELLYDFVDGLDHLVYGKTGLSARTIFLISRNDSFIVEIEIGDEWTSSIYADCSELDEKINQSVAAIMEMELNISNLSKSISLDLEIKGSLQSVINWTSLTIQYFDKQKNAFVEINLSERLEQSIISIVHETVTKMLDTKDQHYFLKVSDGSIESFLVHLPGKENIELLIKNEN